MDSLQKWYSDAQKTIKRLSSGSARYEALATLLQRSAPSAKGLAEDFASYWLSESKNEGTESPTEAQVQKLAALFSLLEGSSEGTDCLSIADWKELCSLTNVNAEDMPLETLNSLMAIFLEHKAF